MSSIGLKLRNIINGRVIKDLEDWIESKGSKYGNAFESLKRRNLI